ncbi:hypothetical protein MMC18_002712 [Xylographa bjoerkii]|nr:hypothetical protein [Xylographa bjoerkii]
MPGIPSRPDLQFDLFDALGLNPTNARPTLASIHKAWRRVSLQLHPDKLATATHIPAFPTYLQAQQAKDYLLAEDKATGSPEDRIRKALASGRRGYRSTWNPWAELNTEQIRMPIPGAPNVDTHGPAPEGPDARVPAEERQERRWAEREEGSEVPDWEGRKQWGREERRAGEAEDQGWSAERQERWWAEREEGSEVPDWEGRKQWGREERKRERQAERDRGGEGGAAGEKEMEEEIGKGTEEGSGEGGERGGGWQGWVLETLGMLAWVR